MKWAVLVVCGVAGGVGGAALTLALEPQPAATRAAAERAAPAAGEGADYAALESRILDLEQSVAGLAAARPGKAELPPPSAKPGDLAATERPAEEAGGAAALPADLAELVRQLRGRKLRNDDYGRLFGWLTMHKERVPEVVAALEKEIELDPRNADLRVALATVYVADLTNNKMPGPQQGIVWAKAVTAYDAALAIEPEHWQARFGKAFGTSMVPEFLGQRPEAIRQFEELIEIQKRRAPEPEYAGTYFRLGTLYKDAGNAEKAREVWNAGLALFPENEELKGALDTSTKK